jgi:isochorismate hydrolase
MPNQDFRAASDHGLQCLAMGNRPSEPRTALLIVDVQIGLVALMSAEVRDSVLPKIKTLLTEARTSGVPVIYIQHDGAEGHPLEAQTEGWEIYPSLQPAEGECVIRKRESDSFFGTTLQRDLIPCFRTKLSMISAKGRGRRYVEEQAHGSADDRGAEAGGSGA